MIYVSRVAAIAASATRIVSYAAALWSPLGSGAPWVAAIVGYIALATVLNAAGVRAAMAGVYVISFLKLTPLLLLIPVGAPSVEWGLAIPAIGFLLTMWLMSHSTADHFMIAGLIVAVGTVVFWLCTRANVSAGASLEG